MAKHSKITRKPIPLFEKLAYITIMTFIIGFISATLYYQHAYYIARNNLKAQEEILLEYQKKLQMLQRKAALLEKKQTSVADNTGIDGLDDSLNSTSSSSGDSCSGGTCTLGGKNRKAEKKSLPLAFQNKNPLNVKTPDKDTWQGQIGEDNQGHAVFETWEHGMRAASLVLKNYAKKHKIATIEGVITRFAEGNQKDYIKFVCKRLGVKPDQKINLIQKMPELLQAMARFECGRQLPEKLFLPYDVLARL